MIEIKNSNTQESEENEMLQITNKLGEYICNNLCQKPYAVPDQNSADTICAGCRVHGYTDQILEQYEKVNDFQHSLWFKLGKKYSKIIMCDECVYQAHEKSTDIHWCRLTTGLDGVLKQGDCCSRGKRREQELRGGEEEL